MGCFPHDSNKTEGQRLAELDQQMNLNSVTIEKVRLAFFLLASSPFITIGDIKDHLTQAGLSFDSPHQKVKFLEQFTIDTSKGPTPEPLEKAIEQLPQPSQPEDDEDPMTTGRKRIYEQCVKTDNKVLKTQDLVMMLMISASDETEVKCRNILRFYRSKQGGTDSDLYSREQISAMVRDVIFLQFQYVMHMSQKSKSEQRKIREAIKFDDIFESIQEQVMPMYEDSVHVDDLVRRFVEMEEMESQGGGDEEESETAVVEVMGHDIFDPADMRKFLFPEIYE